MTAIRLPSSPAPCLISWSITSRRRYRGLEEEFMTMHRRSFASLLSGWGLSLVSIPAFAQGKTVEVAMKQGAKSRFDPDTITIAAGDTVKWTNTGFVTHSVTFDPSMAAKAGDVVLPAGVMPF